MSEKFSRWDAAEHLRTEEDAHLYLQACAEEDPGDGSLIRAALNDVARAGVMAKQTMRAFDEMCLTPVEEMTPEEIRELRLRERASQAVFARYLNVTTSLVSQWERGEKRPRGASLKLLTLVAKNGLGAVA